MANEPTMPRSIPVALTTALALVLLAVFPAPASAATVASVNDRDLHGNPDATAAWFGGKDKLCAEGLNRNVSPAIAYLKKPNGRWVHAYDKDSSDRRSTCRKIDIGSEGSTAKLKVCMWWTDSYGVDLHKCGRTKLVYT